MQRVALCVLLSLGLGSSQTVADIVWVNPANSNWTVIPSAIWSEPTHDLEAADDFNVNGPIERIVVGGYNPCLVQCFPPPVVGVFVRFYESTPAGPGALQQEQFIAAGDPGLIYNPSNPTSFDVRLPSPFAASGQHFVSIQPVFDGGFYWAIWVSSHNHASGSALWVRDNQAGGDWAPFVDILGDPLNDDLTFTLYGEPGGQPPGSCGRWTVVPTPDPGGTTHAILRDLSAISATDMWAVGEYTELVTGSFVSKSLAMHWDGSSWSQVPTPNPSPFPEGTYVSLDAVAAASSDDVWAAGGARIQGSDGFLGTHLFIIHWDGQSWTSMSNLPQSPGASGENVRDIVVIAPDDVWFFGDWVLPQMGLALHWNGSNFTRVPMPFLSNGGHGIEKAAALGPDDIWAVGGGGDGDWNDYSNIFHFDGSNWTHVPGPTPGFYQRLWDVHAFASDDVWTVGSYQEGNQILPLMLHWDGSSWTQFASPAGGGSLAAFAPDHMLSIGGGIARWDGESWQSDSIAGLEDVVGPALGSLAVLDTCDVWGVGREIVGGDLLTLAAHLQPVQLSSFRGDMNCDGRLSLADIGPMVLALTNPTQYALALPACNVQNADLNGDGQVSVSDIGLFVSLIR